MSKTIRRSPILSETPRKAIRDKLIEFANLYRGGAETEELRRKLTGNSTACYTHLHPKCARSTAETRASGYLNHPIVQAILQEKAKEVAEQADVSEAYIIEMIRNTVERCAQAKPVTGRDGKPVMVETPDGDLAAAYTFDASSVLKGCELLGKRLKLWVDKVEANVNGGQSLSDLLKQARDESE